MSVNRMEKLAAVHGFSARFTPDGTEGNEGDPDTVEQAIKDAEAADLKDNTEYNKVRQQSQQHEANATKAREQADAATSQLSEANEQVESLKADLAAAEAKASEAGVEDIDLNEDDYSDTDLALVKSIKKLNDKINAKDAKIGKLEKTANDFQASKQDEKAKAQREEAYQDILNDFDDDYGPEYRNAAVKEFDALCKAGEVKGGAAKATRILDKCYKNAVKAVKDAEAGNKKKGIRPDSGSGGGAGASLSGIELTEGSLEDVTKQAAGALNTT